MPNRPRSPQKDAERPEADLPESGGAPNGSEDAESVNREGDADIDAEEAFDEQEEALEDSSFEDEEE
jgi:hypothetical protein